MTAARAVKQIGELAGSRGASVHAFLIHRTNETWAPQILEKGLDTHIDKYAFLQSTATIHGKLDREFEAYLGLPHNFSTHHVVLAVPQHSLDSLLEKIGKAGANVTPGRHLDKLAEALGGLLPVEWIVGVFNCKTSAFEPNPRFNPANAPQFTNLKQALEEFKKKPGKRPG